MGNRRSKPPARFPSARSCSVAYKPSIVLMVMSTRVDPAVAESREENSIGLTSYVTYGEARTAEL